MSNINVRVTNEEKNMAEDLRNYLFMMGKIEKDTLSDAIRCSIHFTTNEILKTIERERYVR